MSDEELNELSEQLKCAEFRRLNPQRWAALIAEVRKLRLAEAVANESWLVCVPNETGNGCGCPPAFYTAREAWFARSPLLD